MNRSRLNSKRRRFYKHLRRWKAYLSLAIIVSVIVYFIVIGFIATVKDTFNIIAEAPTVARAETVEPTPTPTLTEREQIEVVETPTQKEIEQYVKTIFGSDARVAIAISHNECGPLRPEYPKCVLHSEVEYSVGLFQINLYNSKQWIHAGRIPGQTMEEKVEWLKNPFNNTLYAYWVFQNSGWNPWSAYTNGNYLRSL
jgi:hypothetical protein